jgi:isocitrate dehydrogenase
MLSRFSKRSFASFSKTKVSGSVVEMDGDEMTRVIWQWIKDIVSAISGYPVAY